MAVDASGNPIDPNAPATTGGSGLGDLLSGIAGAPVNRPALGAGIVQGQALAGLRTAQTEEALTKAMAAREQASAKDQFEQSLVNLKDQNGNPVYSPSQAHAVAVGQAAGGGNFEQLNAGLKLANQLHPQAVLGDPTQIGTPAATAAGQVMEGKPAELQTVPEAYAVPAGAPAPVVHLSPVGAANVGEKNAMANAAQTRADHPAGAQNPFANDPELAGRVAQYIMMNPAAAGNLRGTLANGGPQAIDAILTAQGFPRQAPAPGVVPPNQVHPGVGTPGVAPPAPGQPTVTPLAPGQDEHNAPQHTPPNGITPAPGVSLSEQAKVRNDFASGTGAKQATSLNTMYQHSQLFDKLADQIGNGNFTPTNEINVLWQKATGSPAPANLQTAASFLGREAVRATVNSGAGTGEERELQVPANASPEQMHGVAQTLRSLALGQLNSLDLRARRGGVDISQLLSPETQAGFGFHSGGNRPITAAPGATPAGQIPSYSSEQEALAAGHKAGDRVVIGGVTGTLQ